MYPWIEILSSDSKSCHTLTRICCSIAILCKDYSKFNLRKIQKCTSLIHIVFFLRLQLCVKYSCIAATFRWLTCPDHLNKKNKISLHLLCKVCLCFAS
jgi:hypothetical protein